MAFQYVVMIYNLLAGNYVIIQPASGVEAAQEQFDPHHMLDRERKPYLNPKLRITDLCTVFGTNRTYMSAFINREYGMNFSRYINKLRLNEIDRLRKDLAHSEQSGLELVLTAGFSNYKGYLRSKKIDDDAST